MYYIIESDFNRWMLEGPRLKSSSTPTKWRVKFDQLCEKLVPAATEMYMKKLDEAITNKGNNADSVDRDFIITELVLLLELLLGFKIISTTEYAHIFLDGGDIADSISDELEAELEYKERILLDRIARQRWENAKGQPLPKGKKIINALFQDVLVDEDCYEAIIVNMDELNETIILQSDSRTLITLKEHRFVEVDYDIKTKKFSNFRQIINTKE